MLSILDINFPSEFRCYVQYEDGSVFYGKNLNKVLAHIENDFLWRRHYKADVVCDSTGEVIMSITCNYAAFNALREMWE